MAQKSDLDLIDMMIQIDTVLLKIIKDEAGII